MSVVGIGLIVVFAALSGLHFYWGMGGFWPGTDPQSLAERVAGTRGRAAPGFVACAAVAVALLAAAGIVFAGQYEIAMGLPALLVYGGYATLIAVFGLRGLAPYVTPAFAYARGTPFHDLNRRYYAPLCLVIAAALVADFPPGVERMFG